MATTWTFRLRYQLARGYRIDVGETEPNDVLEVPLHTDEGDFELLLPGGPNESQAGVITGTGYPDEASARAAGEKVRTALRIATVETGLPADLGIDRVTSGVGKSVREAMEANHDVQIRPRVHGLDVFEQYAPVAVLGFAATPTVTQPLARVVESFKRAIGRGVLVDARTTLAADIFLSSQFEFSARARVLSLVSALEAMAETEDRPAAVAQHVDDLVRLTRVAADAADTSDERSEFESLLGGLLFLRQRSITWAVRRLATNHTPPGKTYLNLPPDRFVTRAYSVRSQLAHTGESDEGKDLRRIAGELHWLVRDILLSTMGVPDHPVSESD